MKNGTGFMGSQFIWNDGNYRKYYAVKGNKVEQWEFEKDKETKKYFPYGPGQKVMNIREFKDLLKTKPINKIQERKIGKGKRRLKFSLF